MPDLNLSAALLGGLQGQIGSFVKQYFDLKKHKIDRKYRATQDIRKNRFMPFVYLQGICALLIIGYICFVPFLSAFLGIPIEVAYEESNGFFTSLFTGDESISWKSLGAATALAPVHIYLASACAFYLFGTSKGR